MECNIASHGTMGRWRWEVLQMQNTEIDLPPPSRSVEPWKTAEDRSEERMWPKRLTRSRVRLAEEDRPPRRAAHCG